jgi:predicted nucleic acid-binding protein
LIVPDASALLEILLRTPAAEAVSHRIFRRRVTLHVPHLLDLEVAQVLRRYSAQGELTETRAGEAVADLLDFPLTRYPHDLFLGRIWELRSNLTAYDAAYVALAEALPAPLVTRDARLGKSTGHRARIEVL